MGLHSHSDKYKILVQEAERLPQAGLSRAPRHIVLLQIGWT